MPSILVLNPNSSKKVTENLKATVDAPPSVSLFFYTAPAESPAEITGSATLIESEKAVLEDIQNHDFTKYDGILVACYSDHPLVYSLATYTKKPVLGIMHATLLYSYANASFTNLIILTSTSGWLPLLDEALIKFAGAGSFPTAKFHKSAALDVLVLNLSDPVEFANISQRVLSILNAAERPIDCVLLGCAGMAGLDKKLLDHFPGIVFIDSVKAGVNFLTASINLRQWLSISSCQ